MPNQLTGLTPFEEDQIEDFGYDEPTIPRDGVEAYTDPSIAEKTLPAYNPNSVAVVAARGPLPPPPPLSQPGVPLSLPPVRNNLPPPPPVVNLAPPPAAAKPETTPLVSGGKRGSTNADGKDICIPIQDRKSYMVYAMIAMCVKNLKSVRDCWDDAKGLDIKKLDAAILACQQVADGPFAYLQMDREFTIEMERRRPELLTPEQDAAE